MSDSTYLDHAADAIGGEPIYGYDDAFTAGSRAQATFTDGTRTWIAQVLKYGMGQLNLFCVARGDGTFWLFDVRDIPQFQGVFEKVSRASRYLVQALVARAVREFGSCDQLLVALDAIAPPIRVGDAGKTGRWTLRRRDDAAPLGDIAVLDLAEVDERGETRWIVGWALPGQIHPMRLTVLEPEDGVLAAQMAYATLANKGYVVASAIGLGANFTLMPAANDIKPAELLDVHHLVKDGAPATRLEWTQSVGSEVQEGRHPRYRVALIVGEGTPTDMAHFTDDIDEARQHWNRLLQLQRDVRGYEDRPNYA